MVVTSKHRTHKVMEAAIRELMGAGTPPRFKFKDTYASIEFPSGYTIPAQATLEAKYDELLALEEGIQKTVMEGDLEVGTSNLFVDTETGNVGIGTTAPAYTLDVHGTANVGALTVTSVSGDGSGLTALNGDQVTTGTVAAARIANLDASKITTGTITRPVNTSTVTIDDYLIHDGDTNTKIGFPANDTFTVTTANSERLRVDSSGNVGIGTADPLGNLHVRGENVYLQSALVSNCTWRIMPQTGNATKLFRIYDQDNATDRLVIDASGNVGIGETSPQYKLTVVGDVSVRSSLSTGRNLAREFGTVIAYSSQYNSGRGAANIINGAKNFENGSNDWITASGQRTNAYVVIDLGAAYTVDRMVVYNQNEYSNSRREVKGFTLTASSDNSTWVTILTSECGRSNAHEPNPGWSFRIPSDWDDDNEGRTFRYWKFTMNTFHGTDSYGGITELELYASNEAIQGEVSSSSIVAQDVYTETGNFSRGLTVGKGYGGTSTGDGNVIIEGSVGIGTVSPPGMLSIYTGSTTKCGFSIDRYATGEYRTEFYQGSYGLDIKVGYASVAPASVVDIERFSATSSRLRINSPGNLRTDGGVSVTNYTDITNAKMIFDTGGRFRLFDDGDSLYFSSAGGNGTLAATTVLSMHNNSGAGYSVGIGTTNPGNYKLNVNGPALLGSGSVISGGSYLDGVYFDTFGESANKVCLFRASEDDDNVYFRFRNQQSIHQREIGGVVQGYLQEYSDDRLKVNERYLTDGLDVIKRLKPQVYDKRPDLVENLERDGYNVESIEKKEVGFIAQDLYYEVPELKHIVDVGGGVTPAEHITIGDDPTEDPDYSSWGNVAAGVRYTEIIPYNTAAIQDLSNLRDLDVDRITVLESQVSNLLARVQTLESGTP